MCLRANRILIFVILNDIPFIQFKIDIFCRMVQCNYNRNFITFLYKSHELGIIYGVGYLIANNFHLAVKMYMGCVVIPKM